MEFALATVHETIAATLPDREALIFRDRRLTHAELAERSRRLANYLVSRGVSVQRERPALANHEAGQDFVGLYLRNGNEYLEGWLGAAKARAAAFNVNYRYVDEELLYLFENARARAVVYHAAFAPRIAAIRDRLPVLEVLIQVEDGSGEKLLPGAIDYEEALAFASPEPPRLTPSPDDLYVLYTGGTTGMPKGVLWRGHDIFVAALGGRGADGRPLADLPALVERLRTTPGFRILVGPPLMHGAAQWASFTSWMAGGTLVFPNENEKVDAADLLRTVERERCMTMTIVGDAFARPLLEELAAHDYDLASLKVVSSGGAPLSSRSKRELLDRLPTIVVIDGIGSSEGGVQGSSASTKDALVAAGDFRPAVDAAVVSEDLSRVLAPDQTELGWFAQRGHVPLGYLGDPAKTARTFPVIGGVRWSVPGDRARHSPGGTIEVLGRDSTTIVTGGEKVFAEEVENALKLHPDVFDVVVTGRASERWGQEVVAVVQLRAGATVAPEALREAAGLHLARYKLPKVFVFRAKIERSPSGKADYRWARAQAEAEA